MWSFQRISVRDMISDMISEAIRSRTASLRGTRGRTESALWPATADLPCTPGRSGEIRGSQRATVSSASQRRRDV